MLLSRLISKEIFKAATRSEDTYQENRGALFDHLNSLLNYYQYTQDIIFSHDEIKGIIYIHYLNVLQNTYADTGYNNMNWTGQISLTFVVKDYLVHKKLTVKLKTPENQLDKQFDFDQKISFSFSNPGMSNYLDLKQILFGYYLKGRIDLHIIRYMNKKLTLKTSIEHIDKMHSSEEFWMKYQIFEGHLESIKKLFLASLNDKNTDTNSFLQFLEDNFYFLLMKSHKKILNKIVKLLFLALNRYTGEVLKKCITVLNKLISKDYNFNSQLLEHEVSFYGLALDVFKNVKGRFVIIYHSCLVEPGKYSFNTLVLPYHETLASLINTLNSNFISFYILDDDRKIVFRHRLISQKRIGSDLINFQEEHFFKDDLHQIKEFYNARFLKINLFENNHLDEDDIVQHTNKLVAQDFSLISNLNMNNLKACTFEHKFHDIIQHDHNPIYNFRLLKKVRRILRTVIKKFSLSGLIIENFASLFHYLKLDDADIESIDKFKNNLLNIKDKHFMMFGENMKTDLADPAYVYLALKLFKNDPNFYLITPDGSDFLSLGYTIMINKLIESDVCSKAIPNTINYLISQVNRNFGMYTTDSNFIIKSSELAANHLNYIFDRFVNSIRNTLNLIFVRDITVNQTYLSRTSFEFNDSSFNIQFLEKLVYFPILINENKDNNYLPTALIHNNQMQIYLEKLNPKADPLISFPLRKLYNYFKQRKIIVDYKTYYIREGNDDGKLHNFYEITHNMYHCIIEADSIVLHFTLVSENELGDVAKVPLSYAELYWNTPNYDKYYRDIKNLIAGIKDFVAKYNAWRPEDFLDEFITLLSIFKVQTINEINKFFSLTQIKRKKRNYSLFFLLVEALEANYNEYETKFNFSRDELQKYIKSFSLGPVVALTPEYGEFVKVGGLAVMIEDLIIEMTAYHENFVVIMPYYNVDKSGKSGYLADKGVKHHRNILIHLHNITYEIGVFILKRDNITFYFLHHMYLFPVIYPIVS